MLEGNKVEVCQLGSGPQLPVGEKDVLVVPLQVSSDLLKAAINARHLLRQLEYLSIYRREVSFTLSVRL